MYLGAPDRTPDSARLAERTLAAYGRVARGPGRGEQVTLHVPPRQLGPGRGEQVTLHVPPRQLRCWTTKSSTRTTATRTRDVSVGSSARATSATERIRVTTGH